jgi:AcrR family transcriptional regulator
MSPNPGVEHLMKNGRAEVASVRRAQIVDAAVAVIAEQGIQNLSLSEIEQKVGMSRGQLTYYFKTKEDILLAVFDRLLTMMCKQHEQPDTGWLEVVRQLLHMILQDIPAHPEFHALQHTFLSQISHRDDFRQRLADLYEQWRQRGAEDLERQLQNRPAVRKVSPRALSTLVQAMLHGLAVQKAADPNALETQEMVHLCLDLLGTYLWVSAGPRRKSKPAKKRSPRYRTPLIGHGISYERNNK